MLTFQSQTREQGKRLRRRMRFTTLMPPLIQFLLNQAVSTVILGTFRQMAKPGNVSIANQDATSTSQWLLIKPRCTCLHPLGPQRLPDLNLHLPSSSRMIGLWIKTRPWALIGLVLPHSIFEYKMNQPMRTLTRRSVTSWMHQSPLSLHRLHLLHRWLQHPVLYLQLYLMKMTLHHHLQIYLLTPLEMFNSNHLSLSTGRSRTRISRPNEPGMTFKKPSAIDHLNLHHYHRNLHYNHLNQHLNHNILHHINLLLDLNDVKTNNLHHIRQLHLMVTSPLKTQQSCPMTLKLT